MSTTNWVDFKVFRSVVLTVVLFDDLVQHDIERSIVYDTVADWTLVFYRCTHVAHCVTTWDDEERLELHTKLKICSTNYESIIYQPLKN